MADVSTFQAASCACAIQDMYLDETIGVSVSVSQKQTFPIILHEEEAFSGKLKCCPHSVGWNTLGGKISKDSNMSAIICHHDGL